MKVARLSSRILLGLFLATSFMVGVKPTQAAFPGKNGKIVFKVGGNGAIYTMNPDGTGQTRLTTDSGSQQPVVWSPDGKAIAFVRYSKCSANLGDER